MPKVASNERLRELYNARYNGRKPHEIALTITTSNSAQNGRETGVKRKYRNIPTATEHGKFASIREANKCGELARWRDAGYISELEFKKSKLKYPLEVNGRHITIYEADARFKVLRPFEFPTKHGTVLLQSGQTVVCDAKGFETPAYKIKKRLMLAVENIEILEL